MHYPKEFMEFKASSIKLTIGESRETYNEKNESGYK